jgi:DNA-binding SARP family transcriptional activator
LPRLTIALLGPPRVEQDGTPIAVDTRKAIALLAYLALGDDAGASRSTLAALFWPDVDQSRAHAALRRTLSTLHKALAGAWLRIDREQIALPRTADVGIDVFEFQARLEAWRAHGHPAPMVCDRCLAALAEAAALYRDDFMAGFTLRDSPGFDDWQFFQAEALRRGLASALERLVAGLSRRAEHEKASSYARRWLAQDPLHEPAHRRLMELYAWAGQRSAALRQYQDCVRVLDKELGVAPLDETTQLYFAIRDNRLAPPPTAPVPRSTAEAAPPAAPADREPPLVGRAAELLAVRSAYQAIGPDGRLIVIEGEAGIGKTRLAEAALEPLRAQGAVALVARCYEGELNLAYGPFVEALRAALGHAPADLSRLAVLAPHWLAEAARLLPELQAVRPDLPPTPPSDSPGAQSRFFEAVRQVLLTVLTPPAADGAPPLPGVLLIDDAHWIDEASLDLLTYLVRRLRGQPMGLLVTWRGGQVPASHRLRHLLAEALRSGLAASVSPGRLSLDAVMELTSAMMRRQARDDLALVQRLYHETEGLPFFVVEYLNSLAQAAEQGGELPWALPGGVRSLLDARLASVDETARQLLHAAAVIGRSFELDTLQAASGRSDEETVQGLEALMAAGLVTEVSGRGVPGSASEPGGPAYDFGHEKLRALAYEQTSQARRRLLHRRVAEALRARRPGVRAASVASQVAQHYQLAGHDRDAAEFFQLAGEHARVLYANGEALAHYQAALALGHPDPAALHEAIGDLRTLQGDYPGALNGYTAAAEAAGPGAPAAFRARLQHKLGNVYQRRGDWLLAEDHYAAAQAAQTASTGAGVRARLVADWSLAAHRRGDTERATALAAQSLALAEDANEPHALAQAHNLLGILATNQDQPSEALRHLERSLALAEAQGDPGARAAALNNLALAYAAQGERAHALQLAEQALALTAAQGDRHREAALHSHVADLLYATGQAEAAMQHLKQSVSIYAEIGAQAGALQPEIWKLSEW